MDYDYKEDLKIDRYYLDDIIDTHAELYNKWAELYVEAKDAVNKAKDDAAIRMAEAKNVLEKTRAELDLTIRHDYDQYGFEKITDKIAESWIVDNDKYQECQRFVRLTQSDCNATIRKAEKTAEKLKVARDSFDHRKSMIEQQVKLYVAGFWSKPSQPKEMKDERGNRTSEEVCRRSSDTVKRRRMAKNE